MDERENDQQDKTEEATEERRRQFREEGKLPNTKEVLGSLTLIAFAIIAWFQGSYLMSMLASTFRTTWNMIPQATSSRYSLQEQFYHAFRPILPAFLVGSAIVFLLPVVSGLLLSRFNWSWKKMEFNLNKMNPVNGIKNMLGQNLIVETIKNIAKTVLILAVCGTALQDEILSSVGLVASPIASSSAFTGETMLQAIFYTCLAVIVIGAGDYAWNIYKNEQELKMTRQQLKQELKTHEGDPLIKGQRRRIAREIVFQASVEKVPQATFVVTNPTHYSVAILYRSGMTAPLVVSKGQDYLALRIREIAKQHDIIMIENKPLARALYKTVEIGDEVPSSLYTAVIEVMKVIYQQKGRSYFDRFGIGAQFA